VHRCSFQLLNTCDYVASSIEQDIQRLTTMSCITVFSDYFVGLMWNFVASTAALRACKSENARIYRHVRMLWFKANDESNKSTPQMRPLYWNRRPKWAWIDVMFVTRHKNALWHYTGHDGIFENPSTAHTEWLLCAHRNWEVPCYNCGSVARYLEAPRSWYRCSSGMSRRVYSSLVIDVSDKLPVPSSRDWTAWTFKIGPTGCPEMSVTKDQSTLR
jgi:hypothetical protein